MVTLDRNKYAGWLFRSAAFQQDHDIHYTYFVMINRDAFQAVIREYGIDASVIRKLPGFAEQVAEKVGYTQGRFPNQGKDYFDTLQAYWVMSFAKGMKFREMPGERECIFHIGGTSYLHKSDVELSHWDYWPLSVQYFNLKILETPTLKRFRPRFQTLFDKYGSSVALSENHSEFRQGWRCAEIDKILNNVLRTSSRVGT